MTKVITIDNVSKEYRLGTIGHGLLYRDLQSWWARLRDKEDPNSPIGHPSNSRLDASEANERFWALRNISFEVSQGEILGIIGQNGAGKSTLLKILSRVTSPTEGTVKIKGRLASLLEVGTGFHPELTGRENVYLNGAILGMTKKEITSKFDEIVEFAEIAQFIDTPVKRYSSGMYVRLAFAVAAHLDPEILIVDEVLAVGDLQFQKKCLGKIGDIGKDGRTVLLVSHSMASMQALSTKCLLLDKGQLVSFGSTRDVVSQYMERIRGGSTALGQEDLSQAEHYGTGRARFLSISSRFFYNGDEQPMPIAGGDIEFDIEVFAYDYLSSANVAVVIYDEMGNRLIDVNSLIKGEGLTMEKNQRSSVKFTLKNVLLKPDTYIVALWLGIANQEDMDGVRYATAFRIEARREDTLYTAPFPGVYACAFDYTETTP